MMIWRKARLVKKYIENNYEPEFKRDNIRYRITGDEDFDEPDVRHRVTGDGIRYSKRLEIDSEEERKKYEVPKIDIKEELLQKEAEASLKEKIAGKLDQTWQQALFDLIDNKSIDDVELYKKCGITKQTFSKIRSDENYHPDKDTAIRLCIGLELSLEQTLDLLGKAGYTLSKSIERDLVFRYFIINKEYDLYIIECVLEKLKMKLLLKY